MSDQMFADVVMATFFGALGALLVLGVLATLGDALRWLIARVYRRIRQLRTRS